MLVMKNEDTGTIIINFSTRIVISCFISSFIEG